MLESRGDLARFALESDIINKSVAMLETKTHSDRRPALRAVRRTASFGDQWKGVT
jgi:hypothetical protein